jgi:saccharopine dehydrogenase-like NADP-dependent oxidoreductase
MSQSDKKKVLILGAGMSSSSIIRYCLQNAQEYNWEVRVVDQNLELVNRKLNNHPAGVALNFDALNSIERFPEIEKADLVISMLPARFHIEIAKDCLKAKTNLITPSYVSPEMKELHQEALANNLLFMNEMGVDPGIDHMSACKIMDEIKELKGEIVGFKSFCGGLIAPESDNNPWNYKFTWNPRNVVLAGQGGAAKFIQENQYKYIPYHQLFNRLYTIEIPEYGKFEAYANRDSLSYREVYGLNNIPTIFRGTLRKAGFAEAWNLFIQLGMTDDTYVMDHSEVLSPRLFLNAFLPFHTHETIEEKFRKYWSKGNEELHQKFKWLGLFDDQSPIGLKNATPAQVLEHILVSKLKLEENDKDMLVMYHEFSYELNGESKQVISYMVDVGEDKVYTSMSNTVGLPVAICAKLILTNNLAIKGVQVPVMKEVYEPILSELEEFGINFKEVWK